MLQYIDDLLDGDRASKHDPYKIAENLKEQLSATKFENNREGILAKALITHAEKTQIAIPELRNELLQLIAVMQSDYVRMKAKKMLPAKDLEKQHGNTFSHSINVAMILWKSALRASDVPHLVWSFGWCSAMRDMKEDYAMGIINIPEEVLLQIDTGSLPSYPALVNSEPYKSWIQAEYLHAGKQLELSQVKMDAIKNQSGASLINIFQKSIAKFHTKFKTKKAELFYA